MTAPGYGDAAAAPQPSRPTVARRRTTIQGGATMTDDLTPHGLHRRSLLLGGAGFGAGLVTTAAALDFPARAAGTRTTQHWQGRFTDANTPDWHYLPFTVPRGVRAIDVRYDFQPQDTGIGFSTNVVDIGMFDPSGKGLGDAAGFRGWSGGA